MIRIVLADDHKIVRQGIRMLLANCDGMEVIAEAGDGRTAVQLTEELKPDVVVMDVVMPDLNGVEATRQIMASLPTVKVLALSMHSDSRYVARICEAGAKGYLLKDCAFEELNQAIHTIAKGDMYLSPGITSLLVRDYLRIMPKEVSTSQDILTPRQREVLQMLVEGRSTKEIAAELSVSVKTVETHRQHVMNKLDIHSVAELTKYAIREGLTSLE